MRHLSIRLALALVAASVLAACGGGGGSSSSGPGPSVSTTAPSATAVPTVAPTTTPGPTGTANGTFGPIPLISATPLAITPASGGSTISLTSSNGVSGSLKLGPIDPNNGLGTSYTVRLSNAPFAGTPDFAQTTLGVRGEILYLLAQTAAGQGVAYTGTSTLTLNLPPQYQGGIAYWIALNIDAPSLSLTWPGAPSQGILGTVSGTTVTFNFSNPGLQLVPAAQYSIVFYAT